MTGTTVLLKRPAKPLFLPQPLGRPGARWQAHAIGKGDIHPHGHGRGNHRRQRRAFDAHGRAAQLAEDEGIVEHRIGQNARKARQHGQIGPFRRLERGGVHVIHRGEQIAECHHGQILHRSVKALALGQEQRNNLPGHQKRRAHKHAGHDEHKHHREAHGLAHAADIPPAPVLAEEDRSARTGTEAEEIEHEGDAVGLRHGGIGRIAQSADHQPVHDMQGGGHQLLNHHGQRYHKHVAHEGPVPSQAVRHQPAGPGGHGKSIAEHSEILSKQSHHIYALRQGAAPFPLRRVLL